VGKISEVLVKVIDLKKYFGPVRAVDGISFEIKRGETFALVGESGSGKTTAGMTILRLYPKTGGDVFFQGKDIYKLKKKELRNLRPKMQMIFQGAKSSLNPRMTAETLIGEALLEHNLCSKKRVREMVAEIMERCGLSSAFMNRYPHQFSGGERQRIGIARALALKPDFIVADEPVSSLDISIQSQIINLLMDLQQEYGLTYLFISHDLSLVEYISHRIGIMYLGSLVELGLTRQIFQKPAHPYTQALLSAMPRLNPLHKRERIILTGEMPSPINPPEGCKFHTRCPLVQDKCRFEKPNQINLGGGHFIFCHLFGDRTW
jgi:peptide/nickel transport system ATP-binding protein